IRAGPSNHSDDAIPLLEQKLRKVRAILACDARDENCLHVPEYRESVRTEIHRADRSARTWPGAAAILRSCRPDADRGRIHRTLVEGNSSEPWRPESWASISGPPPADQLASAITCSRS